MSTWTQFKDFLRGEKALTAAPEVIEALRGGENFMIRRAVNKQIAYQVSAAMEWGWADFYKKSPAVRTVIDLITNNVAQLDLRLYEEVDTDEREERPDHPAMQSLRFPNPSYSSDGFVRYMVRSYLLYANAFATIHRDDRTGRRQFAPLPPERIEVRGPGVVPTSYVVWNLDGTESDPILSRNMFHWREEGNFVDPRIGLSKLETLRGVLVEEAALQQAIVELAKSGLVDPSYIWRSLDAPEWSNEARRRAEEDIANRLANARKVPPVLEESMELRRLGVSPRDAQMLDVRKYALQQVASMYGVPLGMVGLADNVEEAREEFIADTLPPICEAFCRQLNLQLVQREWGEEDLFFEFDLREKMMGNERLKALTGAAGVPPLLRDEARAMLNLKKVPGGQEPMTPANMVSGADPKKLVPGSSNPPAPKPSSNVMPIPNPNKPAQDGSHREGEPPEAASVTETLQKFYSKLASGKKENPERWTRELTEELQKTGLNGDAGVMAAQMVEDLQRSLKNGERAEVLNQAKADAPRVAARWEMRPEQMKDLNLPDEAIWERAGFSRDEIDRMRALKLAESLSDD